MSLNRVLRYLNLLLGVLLAAVIVVVYWFVWRVLPKTSGTLSAPLESAATVTRDQLGVPHIKAASLEDALFLQGYVTAQDRLWQMDGLRRLAGGRLSEVVGAAALETDKETRRLRTRRAAEAFYRKMDPKLRALLAQYVRGVNYFIETHRGALPVEFTLLRYDPEPWTVVDSMLAGMQMFRDMTTTWRDEMIKSSMLAAGDHDLVEQLWPLRTGAEVSPGSNAWVISGKLTASGKPLLANDTHVQFGIPSTWHMVQIECPQMKVSGVSLPGLPAVIIGHNDRIAWGVTNLHFDVQDLYVERLDARTGRFSFRGEVRQAVSERELIPVKGAKPVEIANWVTPHGPVWSNDGKTVLSLRWVATDDGGFDFPFLLLNAARNWEEFRAALRRFPGPAQNFVYADVEGNIGYQAAGRLPVRRNFKGDVPVDGSSGEFEWDGIIPFEQLPSLYNPPSGIIATANQNPFPADYPYRVNGSFGPHYRAATIRGMLSRRTGWKPAEMLLLQKDVYSPFSHRLARHLVRAVEARAAGSEQLREAAAILRGWNGQMEKGTAAPMIAALAYQQLRRALAERAAPGKGAVYEAHLAGPVIERLLSARPAAWFKDWDQVLVKALSEAIEEGRQTQGRNLSKWDYGHLIELEIKHPVGDVIPWVGQYFNIGPVPMSGSSSTVKQTTRRLGPSMRFVATPGDWDQSLLNITIGESGQFLSTHYRDQWAAYYGGTSFPMPWSKIEGSGLRVEPRQ